MEHGFERREAPDISEIQKHLNAGIIDLHSEATRSPVELPNRNLIRRILSAASDLTVMSDGERVGLQAAAQKLREVLAELGEKNESV